MSAKTTAPSDMIRVGDLPGPHVMGPRSTLTGEMFRQPSAEGADIKDAWFVPEGETQRFSPGRTIAVFEGEDIGDVAAIAFTMMGEAELVGPAAWCDVTPAQKPLDHIRALSLRKPGEDDLCMVPTIFFVGSCLVSLLLELAIPDGPEVTFFSGFLLNLAAAAVFGLFAWREVRTNTIDELKEDAEEPFIETWTVRTPRALTDTHAARS